MLRVLNDALARGADGIDAAEESLEAFVALTNDDALVDRAEVLQQQDGLSREFHNTGEL